MVIGMMVLCVYIILPVYDKYENTPTVTTVSDTHDPVWNLNFPAITICSNNRIVESLVDKLLLSPTGP